MQKEAVDLIYARLNHPNPEILEYQIGPLENGPETALLFSSGMAAITTALLRVSPGRTDGVYKVQIRGGTPHFIEDNLPSVASVV